MTIQPSAGDLSNIPAPFEQKKDHLSCQNETLASVLTKLFTHCTTFEVLQGTSLKEKKWQPEEAKLHTMLSTVIGNLINKTLSKSSCYELGMSKAAIDELLGLSECTFVKLSGVDLQDTKELLLLLENHLVKPYAALVVYDEKSGVFALVMKRKDGECIHRVFRPNYKGNDEELLKSVSNELKLLRLQYIESEYGCQLISKGSDKRWAPFTLELEKAQAKLYMHFTDTLGVKRKEEFSFERSFSSQLFHLQDPGMKIEARALRLLKSLRDRHGLKIELPGSKAATTDFSATVSLVLQAFVKNFMPKDAFTLMSGSPLPSELEELANNSKGHWFIMPYERANGEFGLNCYLFDFSKNKVEHLQFTDDSFLKRASAIHDSNQGIQRYLLQKEAFLLQHGDISERKEASVCDLSLTQIVIGPKSTDPSYLEVMYYNFEHGSISKQEIDLAYSDFQSVLLEIKEKRAGWLQDEKALGVVIGNPIEQRLLRPGDVRVTRKEATLEYTISAMLAEGVVVQRTVCGLKAAKEQLEGLKKQASFYKHCAEYADIILAEASQGISSEKMVASVDEKISQYRLSVFVPNTQQTIHITFTELSELANARTSILKMRDELQFLAPFSLSQAHLLGAISVEYEKLAPPPISAKLRAETSLDELLVVFDTIDFEDPTSPFYREESVLTNDGKRSSAAEYREALSELIEYVKSRKTFVEILDSSGIESKHKWYDIFEGYLRGVIAHHTQSIAKATDEAQRVQAKRDFQTAILTLCDSSFTISPQRWLSDVTQLYHIQQLGLSRDLSSVDVKDHLLEAIDELKLGVVQEMVKEESLDTDDFWEASNERDFLQVLQNASIMMPKVHSITANPSQPSRLSYAEKYATPAEVINGFTKKLTVQRVVHTVQAELNRQMRGPYQAPFLQAFHRLAREYSVEKDSIEALDAFLEKNGYIHFVNKADFRDIEVTFKGAALLMAHFELLEKS